MAPVTENALLPLQIGINLEDPNSDEAKIWRKALDTIASQSGYKRMVWGTQLENLDIVQIFIEWDSISLHNAFINSNDYPPFLKALESIVSSDISLYHIAFGTPLSHATSGSITEIVSFYFPSSYVQENFEGAWKEFVQATTDHAEGVQGISAGWGVEEVEHCSLRADGESARGRRGSMTGVAEGEKPCPKGKVFVATIGWESVEKHMEYRNTKWFKEGIATLRDQAKGIEMHHVRFKEH